MNYKPEFFHQAIHLLSYALNLVATQNSSLEDEKKKKHTWNSLQTDWLSCKMEHIISFVWFSC